MISKEQLHVIMPFATAMNLEKFYKPLNDSMLKFAITSPARKAAFLAQIAHESGSLRYVREIGDGSAYDVGRLAENLGNTPEDDGDGEFYKGRGLIQITGKANYEKCGKALGIDLLKHPELLEGSVYASESAAWFWFIHGLNEIADSGDFRKITKIINGGFNGIEQRVAYWEKAKKVLWT